MTDTKRQPLPWFAFDVAGYLKDTLRLTTESHGSYLLLMLDYYATCEPCPDDNDILAAVAKLPVEVWKAKHRKVLEPFFKIRDGKWVHDRIEREMLEAERKLTSSRDRAAAGGRARAAQFRAETEKRLKTTGKHPVSAAASSQEQQQGQPEGQPKLTPEEPHLHLHKESSLSVLDLAVEKDNSGDNSPDPDVAIKITPISERFWPCDNHIAMCRFDSADDATIKTEVTTFIAHHREQGSLSADWDASFAKWWERWKQHRAKQAKPKAPPRVEVNAPPNVEQWRSWLTRWNSDSFWPRAAGPDPSTGRCKAPPSLMVEADIDPKTGFAMRRPALAQ